MTSKKQGIQRSRLESPGIVLMPCLFGFVKERVLLKALFSSDRRDIDTKEFCKLDFYRVPLAQFNQFHIHTEIVTFFLSNHPS